MSTHIVFLLGSFCLLYQAIFLFSLPEFSFLCRTASRGYLLSLWTISAKAEDRPCLLAAVPCSIGPAGNHIQQAVLTASHTSHGAARTGPGTGPGARHHPAPVWHKPGTGLARSAAISPPSLPHTEALTPASRAQPSEVQCTWQPRSNQPMLLLLHFALVSQTFKWQKLFCPFWKGPFYGLLPLTAMWKMERSTKWEQTIICLSRNSSWVSSQMV